MLEILIPIDVFYKKMIDAHQFEVRNKNILPRYIAVNLDGVEYHIPGEGHKGFIDGQNRIAKFLNEKGNIPEGVYCIPMTEVKTNVVKPAPAPASDGWVLTGSWTQDYQNTGYTCGPSSAQMVFSALGYSFTEQRIAHLAGTTAAGTSHRQLYSAMQSLVPGLQIAEYFRSDIGYNGMANKLKNNCEIILHIRTGALKTDAYGKACWVKDYGHYIYLIGVNTAKSLVKVADPTKGIRDFTFNQMTNAINMVSGQKSVMVFHRP